VPEVLHFPLTIEPASGLSVSLRFAPRAFGGRFTHDYAKGLLDAPEDREPAVRKLIEESGGKLISFYHTTGESDFLIISEANDTEAIMAALIAKTAAGVISDVSTARAWTGAEYKTVLERAAKVAKAYRPPGKK
jgi:uncharacterized protein with GYD domain